MGVKLQKISRYVILKLIAPISDRDTLFLFGLDQILGFYSGLGWVAMTFLYGF